MEEQGYEADRMFNALPGATRLSFHDPVRDRPVDVYSTGFVTAHRLDLRDSTADGLTIALAVLLLTKIQVVDINEQGVRELLGTFELSSAQSDSAHDHVSDLDDAPNRAGKGARWKRCARVGERIRWYEEPEQARS